MVTEHRKGTLNYQLCFKKSSGLQLVSIFRKWAPLKSTLTYGLALIELVDSSWAETLLLIGLTFVPPYIGSSTTLRSTKEQYDAQNNNKDQSLFS